MSRESKLISSTLILSIGTILPKALSFVTIPILTACLTKEQYGAYDLITILASLLLPVTTLQIHTAAFRFLIKCKNDVRRVREIFSNVIAFVIPVAFVSLFVLYIIVPIESSLLKIFVCMYLLLDTLVTEIREIARGISEIFVYAFSSAVSAITNLGLIVFLVGFMREELIGAMVALVFATLCSLLFLAYKLKIADLFDYRLVNKEVLKDMLLYSWPMVPNNLSSWVMRASDRFVITGVLGMSATGIYAVANKIPNVLTLAQHTFNLAWHENASIVVTDDDAAEYYSKMFSTMICLYAGCLGIVAACTPILFRILVKGNYQKAYPQIPILIFGMFFSCVALFLGGIYIACKATKNVGISTTFAALLNVIVDIALINRIGIYAASLSTLLSYVLLFVYRMIDIKKLVNIKYDYKEISFIIVLIAIECLLCFINHLITNVVNIFIGIISFCFLNKDTITVFRKKLVSFMTR